MNVGHLTSMCTYLKICLLLKMKGMYKFSTFLFQVLEFDNLNAGLLVLIGQIADGFSTVFVGVFSDKGDDLWLCNRFGQRKAWHLIGVICILSRLL